MNTPCWEYFNCSFRECPVRESDKPCWEVEGRCCQQFTGLIQSDRLTKQRACEICQYKKISTRYKEYEK